MSILAENPLLSKLEQLSLAKPDFLQVHNYELEMGMTKHKVGNWMQHKKHQQAEKQLF